VHNVVKEGVNLASGGARQVEEVIFETVSRYHEENDASVTLTSNPSDQQDDQDYR
jgi:hypothetical protein